MAKVDPPGDTQMESPARKVQPERAEDHEDHEDHMGGGGQDDPWNLSMPQQSFGQTAGNSFRASGRCMAYFLHWRGCCICPDSYLSRFRWRP